MYVKVARGQKCCVACDSGQLEQSTNEFDSVALMFNNNWHFHHKYRGMLLNPQICRDSEITLNKPEFPHIRQRQVSSNACENIVDHSVHFQASVNLERPRRQATPGGPA